MICEHRIDNQCELGNNICKSINTPKGVPCRDDAFNACSTCKCPHTYNYVVGSLTFTYLESIKITNSSKHEALINLIQQGPNCKIGGPGTELKRLLKHLGVVSDSNCDCDWHVVEMDYWGSEKCRLEINTILGWLKESATKKEWPWNEKIVHTLILLACDLADGASWIEIVTVLPFVLMRL